MLRKNSLCILVTGALSLASTALAQDISWDLRGAAVGGSGCRISPTALYTFDNVVLVNTNSLGISLSGPTGKLAARMACSVRIPVTVPAGYYVSEARSANKLFSYRNAYDSSAVAKIIMSVGTTSATVLSYEAPMGGERSADISYTDFGNSRAEFCEHEGPTTTILGINMAISALRPNTSERVYLSLGAPGGNLEIASFSIAPCP